MIDLLLITLAPAAGGALALHLWMTRTPAVKHTGLAVGQATITRRGKRRQAVRVGGCA